MERTELSATASTGGPSIEVSDGETDTIEVIAAPARATLSVVIESDVELDGDALARISVLINREAKRCSEIAFVNARDQKALVHENRRIAALPKDRPHIVATIGRKDPDSVTVIRGEYEITHEKKKMTIRAPKETAR
jgi:hypothetical protein